MGTMPEPYTPAFYGMETGSMNPKEHPKSAQRAGTSGSRQAALATGITMGTTMVALAVLEVVSEIRTAHRS